MAEIKINLLEVDLTSGKINVKDVTADAKLYWGGRGIWNKYAWDNMPKGVDPYAPENVFHAGVGPVTGLEGTKTIFSFKSPMTGWAGRGAMSGFFGAELIRAGYMDGIMIKGKASQPSYLYVYDDKVEIRPCPELWGKMKLEAEVTLRDALLKETGKDFGVAIIGPAGENKVSCAQIAAEYVHSGSKWGGGAVMGSKNLKAIAVKGTKQMPYADHKAVWDLWSKYATHPEALSRKIGRSRYGNTTSIPQRMHNATAAIKNNHLGWDPVCLKSNSLEHQLRYNVWTDGCPGCAEGCEVPWVKRTDYGVFSGEFRHDNNGSFTGNVLLSYEEMCEINPVLNELGMDGEDAGGLVAWAIDMYTNGIITKADCDGLELKWGDTKTVQEFLKKMAYRKGKIPSLMADGWRPTEKAVGEKGAYLAWEVHGAGANTQFTRADIKTSRNAEFLASHNGARMGATVADAGMNECATICRFATGSYGAIWGSDTEATRLFMNAVTGFNYSKETFNDVIMRNYYLGRAVSMREGYHPAKDDFAPQRLYDEPLTDKYGKVYKVDKAAMEARLKEYRRDTNKLTEDGLLPRKELQRLGIDFVIAALDPMKCIG